MIRLVSLLNRRKGFWHALAVALVVLLVGASLTTYVGNLIRDANVDRHKAAAVSVLSEARARLLGTIGRTLSLGTGLMNYVVVNPRIGELQFRRYSAEMIAQDRSIRSIALAPGNVVRFVHPLEGNERVIGLDYASNREQWRGIHQAMESRSVVLAGPVNLVQGGRGILARLPIYVPAFGSPGEPARTYWGIASVMFDEQAMLASAGLSTLVGEYEIALQVPGDGERPTSTILGQPDLFERDSARLDVLLPGAVSWQLAAIPRQGWVHTSTEFWLAVAAGYGATLLLAAMSFFVVFEMLRARQLAHHDPLTGLPNRRLLEDRMEQLASFSDRSGLGFQVFFVDLNDFKPINDQHGHAIGDLMLVEIGRRLRSETRRADTVARIGGDEFVVLTPGLMQEADAAQFSRRLAAAVCEPMTIGTATLSVKASVGRASYPQDARSIRELLDLADTRMYAQKQQRFETLFTEVRAANGS
ncbi:diguanylate cyclase domain-containing protein [Pannonibacter tanglangensis]|uniref:Diguanylate cyclase n=1 Tax=Pannonibacter tanglangensis TaxID=2750084 RepID=A0ABW9ZLH0_9HYPH|nr:diguanylate cyclase [Pannonibacter sp. XCT-34]NBN65768.1 diguanylate cyclase [Pannonibacter sp. XCT-34]